MPFFFCNEAFDSLDDLRFFDVEVVDFNFEEEVDRGFNEEVNLDEEMVVDVDVDDDDDAVDDDKVEFNIAFLVEFFVDFVEEPLLIADLPKNDDIDVCNLCG